MESRRVFFVAQVSSLSGSPVASCQIPGGDCAKGGKSKVNGDYNKPHHQWIPMNHPVFP